MEQAIQKANTLIEALGWIREFRDKTTVIKLGGSVLNQLDCLRFTLLDILFMETVGMRPVIVHGGGNRISKAMEQEGIEPRFVSGRRYTDEPTLKIVEKVLSEETNHFLAKEFENLGGKARSLNFLSTSVLRGQPIQLKDESGKPVDLGFVGEVTDVDTSTIGQLCDQGYVPFIPSMCQTPDGQKLNVNADSVATRVAQELNADKLIIISDVPGVLEDASDPDSVISSMTRTETLDLIANGTIRDGMIPKVEACIETLDRGVRKVHIVDGTLRHSLLLEIYTSSGIGTVICADHPTP
ncbi:MAG: acetylglutamate kinase [Planctomycetota bacterium]